MNLKLVIIRGATAVAVLAAGWWALRPLERPDLVLPPSPPLSPRDEPASSHSATTLAALDEAAFRVPLWFVPPPPPAPVEEPKPAPLPPLKLQLLAIVRVPATEEQRPSFRAMLYDPDADKIVEVAAGQSIGDRSVVGVTEREITLRDRAGTRTLSLRPEKQAGGGT